MHMEIKTVFKVSFVVECSSGNEGGMDYEAFGEPTDTLQKALQVWHLATVKEPEVDWIVACYPNVEVKGV